MDLIHCLRSSPLLIIIVLYVLFPDVLTLYQPLTINDLALNPLKTAGVVGGQQMKWVNCLYGDFN